MRTSPSAHPTGFAAVEPLLENQHPVVELTEKELGVFTGLVNGTESREDLLVDVWKFSAGFASKITYKETRMVDVTVGRLRKKLKAAGLKITSKRGVGYTITVL